MTLDDFELEPVHGVVGALSAVTILALWGLSLTLWLTSDWSGSLVWFAPLAILLQTFLHTGLFISAHDAMHGTLCHTSRVVNDTLGGLALFCYALFSLDEMRDHHHDHHDHAGGDEDPDFRDNPSHGPLRWYASFLGKYMTVWQVAGMALVFNLLQHGLGVSVKALLLFWVLPSLASTVQLFFFGTYLPHVPGDEGDKVDKEHHARSLDWPVWCSFLACYHFGYHLEHHRYPYLPWWLLPRARDAREHGGLGKTSRAALRE